MTNNNLVYKVCFVNDGRYYSLNAGSRLAVGLAVKEHPFIIEYKIGKWVKPKVVGSPLLAFAASSIAEHCLYTSTCILECEWKPFPHWPKSRLAIDVVLSDNKFTKEFWEMHKWGSQYGAGWPNGTVFCSAVKPLRLL